MFGYIQMIIKKTSKFLKEESYTRVKNRPQCTMYVVLFSLLDQHYRVYRHLENVHLIFVILVIAIYCMQLPLMHTVNLQYILYSKYRLFYCVRVYLAHPRSIETPANVFIEVSSRRVYFSA